MIIIAILRRYFWRSVSIFLLNDRVFTYIGNISRPFPPNHFGYIIFLIKIDKIDTKLWPSLVVMSGFDQYLFNIYEFHALLSFSAVFMPVYYLLRAQCLAETNMYFFLLLWHVIWWIYCLSFVLCGILFFTLTCGGPAHKMKVDITHCCLHRGYPVLFWI